MPNDTGCGVKWSESVLTTGEIRIGPFWLGWVREVKRHENEWPIGCLLAQSLPPNHCCVWVSQNRICSTPENKWPQNEIILNTSPTHSYELSSRVYTSNSQKSMAKLTTFCAQMRLVSRPIVNRNWQGRHKSTEARWSEKHCWVLPSSTITDLFDPAKIQLGLKLIRKPASLYPQLVLGWNGHFTSPKRWQKSLICDWEKD